MHSTGKGPTNEHRIRRRAGNRRNAQCDDHGKGRMTPHDLDSLLTAWHRWASSDMPPLGYPSECPTFRLYRPTKVWQAYQYEVGKDGLERQTAPSVWVQHVGPMVDTCVHGRKNPAGGWIIEPMPDQMRWALEWFARGLALGTFAIRNPRLPVGEALDALVTAAKEEMGRRLDV